MSTKKSVSLPLGSPPKLTEDARSNSAPNACKHENKDDESILGKKFLPQNKDFLNTSLDGSSFYLFEHLQMQVYLLFCQHCLMRSGASFSMYIGLSFK